VRHKDLRLQSRFPRKKIWPWVALAAVLLSVGVFEITMRAAERRAQEAKESRPAGRVASAGISGVVRLANGSPAPGIGVYAEPGGQETRSDARGAFHLDIPDGAIVRLHAHHSDIGFGSVEAVAPTTAATVTLQPRATFDVRVMAGERPVEGAQVTVEETVAQVYEADRLTDADGRVVFRGLPSGHLQARATLPTGARGFTDADAHQGEVVEVTVQLHGP
jgi:hypothetical protein